MMWEGGAISGGKLTEKIPFLENNFVYNYSISACSEIVIC